MPPKKVNITFIANDTTRRATLKKRGYGLQKKAYELSALCDIDTCLIVYSEGESTKAPEVWPSAPEARRVIERLKSMPEHDQCRKMMDQEGYARERVANLQEQLRKAERDNWERETKLLLHDAIIGRRPGLAGLTIGQLVSVSWMADERVKKVRDHMAYMRAQPRLPYATTGAGVEVPQQQGRWLMEVVRAGLDIDAVDYSGSNTGSGSYGSGSAGVDMMQLGIGNSDAGLVSADHPGTSFPPV